MRQAGCGHIAMRQDERKLEVTMKIGIISDTRAGSGEDVPQEVARAFEGVDRIFHAGGIHSKEVLDWLERIAPVTAAARLEGGQAEQPQPFMLEVPNDSRVAQQQIIELEGHTIGMVNEIWLPRLSDEIMPGSIGRQRLPDQLLTQMVTDFFETPVDIVVFGRTLYAVVEEHEGILFINPGSPSLPRNVRRLGQVAILELGDGKREARVVELSGLS